MANIKIDASDSLVVLVCESCAGTWRACAWSRDEAHDRAVAHEQRCHPGENDAYRKRWAHLNTPKVGRPRRSATRR
ncbi:hypothetical protein ACFPZL_01125 [Leucobacter soli]|uniref:Uncharacterized protein n=1 Tax=Leucobacter soli TaxID=2812850 RepID=A0A916JZI6_9MICO|nr:hypothetical protein [Leucobacter soli]CAG7618384.1 hypothetical protein LEUCIP111803_02199 [Leucobacter soli]